MEMSRPELEQTIPWTRPTPKQPRDFRFCRLSPQRLLRIAERTGKEYPLPLCLVVQPGEFWNTSQLLTRFPDRQPEGSPLLERVDRCSQCRSPGTPFCLLRRSVPLDGEEEEEQGWEWCCALCGTLNHSSALSTTTTSSGGADRLPRHFTEPFTQWLETPEGTVSPPWNSSHSDLARPARSGTRFVFVVDINSSVHALRSLQSTIRKISSSLVPDKGSQQTPSQPPIPPRESVEVALITFGHLISVYDLSQSDSVIARSRPAGVVLLKPSRGALF